MADDFQNPAGLSFEIMRNVIPRLSADSDHSASGMDEIAMASLSTPVDKSSSLQFGN